MSLGKNLLGGLLSNYTYGIVGMNEDGVTVNPVNALNQIQGGGDGESDGADTAQGAAPDQTTDLAPVEVDAMEKRGIISADTAAAMKQQPTVSSMPMRRAPPPQMVQAPMPATQVPPPVDLGSPPMSAPMGPPAGPSMATQGAPPPMGPMQQARGMANDLVDDPFNIALGSYYR